MKKTTEAATKKNRLKIGGPAMPAGKHTWVRDAAGRITDAYEGKTYDIEGDCDICETTGTAKNPSPATTVGKSCICTNGQLVKIVDADAYVKRGQATRV